MAETFVLPPPAIVSLAVAGSNDRFPVRRIYCVGRNYAEHIKEMGRDPEREAPFFFAKPRDAIVASGGMFPYPPKSENVHHEVELVVAIGQAGIGVPVERALEIVWGYGVGIDMTRRDLQKEAQGKGRPWDTGKGFDHAAPCSALSPTARIGHPSKGRVWLSVDNEMKQDSDIAQMIWNVPETIAHLSQLFALGAGDLIYTGTPAGVGPVKRGQEVRAGIEGVGELMVKVL